MKYTMNSLEYKSRASARHSVALALAGALTTQIWAQEAAKPESEDRLQLAPMRVVSTATRTQRLISEVPIRTEVLPREDIGMRATFNFSQAVELMNGVRVESNCQNCNTSEVQLLGLGGAYNQILFDGMPLLASLGAVYGIEQIPAAFVDRFEVVKGGGSALYGPGALAGVINLVPLAPHVHGGFVQAGIEIQKGVPFWLADGRVNAVLPNGAGGIAVVAQSSRNDAIDFNGDGYSEITEKKQAVAGFQGWFSLSDRTKLRANYQYTWETRRGGNHLDRPEYLANVAESLETKYHRGGLRLDQTVSSDFDFSLGYSFAFIERDSFYGGLGDVVTDPRDPAYDPSELDPNVPGSAAATSFNQYGYTKNPLHYVDSQFNYRLGAHALAFGAQYKRDSVSDENRNFFGQAVRAGSRDKFDNVGVYLQDEWSVSPGVNVVGGGRLDRSSTLDGTRFSPRVAAMFDVNERWKLRAGISTGFRAPEVFSEDLHVDTLGSEPVEIRNSSDLKEESAVTTMAGFEWRNDPQKPVWGVDATVSITKLSDAFVLGEVRSDADGILYRQRSNSEGSTVGGLEANVIYEPGKRFRVNVGASYYQSRYDVNEVVFDDTEDGGDTVIVTRDYLKTPRWGGVFQATWTPLHSTSTYLGLKYTGQMDIVNNTTGTLNRTPEFWVIDWGMTRHFELKSGRHIDVGIGVKNLFDERQRDLESGANRDSTYVYGPRSARSFHVTLKYEF
jgi:outer membrane receptor for ferrienterochelin and colicins